MHFPVRDKADRCVKSGHITHSGFEKDNRVYLIVGVLRWASVFGRKNWSGSWWQNDKEGDSWPSNTCFCGVLRTLKSGMTLEPLCGAQSFGHLNWAWDSWSQGRSLSLRVMNSKPALGGGNGVTLVDYLAWVCFLSSKKHTYGCAVKGR